MRLDINYKKKKNCKNNNHVAIKQHFSNNQQVMEEFRRDIKKFLETHENENTTTQSLWDGAKAVLRGKLMATQSYLQKQEKH